MKILACFYILVSFLDWLTFSTGKAALNRGDLLCYGETIILVNSNMGAFYMVFLSLSYYGYALTLWYVFYWVPSKFGHVTRFKVEDVGLDVHDESQMLQLEDEENLKTVVRELEHDRQFMKEQQKKLRYDSDAGRTSQL